MTMDAWITTVVLVVTLGLLIWDRYPPSGVVLGAVLVLMLADVVDTQSALAGFSNDATLTVAALYVVAAAAMRTGLLSGLVSSALGAGKGIVAYARLLVPSAAISGFVNNTPLVAILIPDILAWSRRRGVSASRFLMPVSFAVVLGGTLTLIGTSTNLVVSGLLQESGYEPFGIFEVTKIGLPVAVAGMLVLILLSIRMIPDRLAATGTAEEEVREFSVEMRVAGQGVAGRTVEDAGLRHLQGVYLVQIHRDGQQIAPVPPEEVLQEGDALTFVGQVDNVLDLQRTKGLVQGAAEHLDGLTGHRARLYEVVVGRSGAITNRTLRESDFRARYDAAVLAIHRAGQRIDSKLGEVRLRHGDTLVLLAGTDFRARWVQSRDFLVVAPLDDAPAPPASKRAPLVALALLGFVLLTAFEVLSPVEAALTAAAGLILTRTISFANAIRAVDLDVILLIAASFGLGKAVESSGLAEDIANGFVNAFDGFGVFGVMLGIVLATSVLTEFISNTAAAAIVLPISLAIATSSAIDPRLMAIAIAIAASTSFLTPIGYQTNTMVYGPGGYKFTDFTYAGAPINVVCYLVIAGMVTLLN